MQTENTSRNVPSVNTVSMRRLAKGIKTGLTRPECTDSSEPAS